MKTSTRILGLTVALLALGGCAEDVTGAPEHEFREETVAPPRPPGGTGFVNNGLHDPQVGGFDPAAPLDGTGLDGSVLDDPDRLATAQYVVECALPEGSEVTKLVDGDLVTFEGQLGLAPEWEDDACDQDCQEWVTACVLARTNVSGQTVALQLKGDHAALDGNLDLAYPIYEASFFGNLFVSQSKQYMCPGPLVGPLLAQLEGRTCSATLGGYCDMTEYAACTLLPLLNPRCQDDLLGGLLEPVLSECRPGTTPTGSGMRTISSYVPVL